MFFTCIKMPPRINRINVLSCQLYVGIRNQLGRISRKALTFLRVLWDFEFFRVCSSFFDFLFEFFRVFSSFFAFFSSVFEFFEFFFWLVFWVFRIFSSLFVVEILNYFEISSFPSFFSFFPFFGYIINIYRIFTVARLKYKLDLSFLVAGACPIKRVFQLKLLFIKYKSVLRNNDSILNYFNFDLFAATSANISHFPTTLYAHNAHKEQHSYHHPLT